MKKILTLIAGMLFIGSSLWAQEPGTCKQTAEVYSFDSKDEIIHCQNQLPANIGKVVVSGPANLCWAADTIDYLELYCVGNCNRTSYPAWTDTVLTLSNAPKTIYLLHTTHSNLVVETIDDANQIKLENADKLNSLSATLANMVEASSTTGSSILMKGIINLILKSDHIDTTLTSTEDGTVTSIDESLRSSSHDGVGPDGCRRKHHTTFDRTNLDFLWGFNNWGTSPLNGLVGMSDPAYDLRTSFSSYQLSYNYRVVMTDHFDLSIGLGYESDVYKYNTPYVEFAGGAFSAADRPSADGYYTSRFVTRYVQLPVGIGYCAKSKHKGFNIRLSAIPALGWCGKHTGLKHELHQSGRNEQDQANLKDILNPYKLDIRLDIDFGGLGVFLQAATLPVFVEGTRIYPIKLGFII